MSNNRLKKDVSVTKGDRVKADKQVVMKSYVTIGLTEGSVFVWSAKNVANLFEVLGYLDLAREEVKKRLREVPK